MVTGMNVFVDERYFTHSNHLTHNNQHGGQLIARYFVILSVRKILFLLCENVSFVIVCIISQAVDYMVLNIRLPSTFHAVCLFTELILCFQFKEEFILVFVKDIRLCPCFILFLLILLQFCRFLYLFFSSNLIYRWYFSKHRALMFFVVVSTLIPTFVYRSNGHHCHLIS